jgi:hypothetical protein
MYKHSMLLLFVIVSQMSITAYKDGNPMKTNQGSGRPLKILAIGDSNGALKDSWINQLKKSGQTILFTTFQYRATQ